MARLNLMAKEGQALERMAAQSPGGIMSESRIEHGLEDLKKLRERLLPPPPPGTERDAAAVALVAEDLSKPGEHAKESAGKVPISTGLPEDEYPLVNIQKAIENGHL